ncbi:hypothetical protein AMTRI_Chr07g28700 [Amborella trichopoda]
MSSKYFCVCLSVKQIFLHSAIKISPASTTSEGYPCHTCPRCQLPSNTSTSSSQTNLGKVHFRCPSCTFFHWQDDYIEGMNYTANLRPCNTQQMMQPPHLTEQVMVNLDERIIQDPIVDALRCIQQYQFYLYITNTFMFVLILFKSS